MKTQLKKMCVLLLAFALVIPLCIPAASAAAPSDISGHWAKPQIDSWLYLGYISGYSDGTFRPNNPITRAEFMALINRSFGYSTTAYIDFTDVKSDDWYYGAVRIATYEGYITGYPDNTMRPDAYITRQEVATVLTRLLDLTPNAVPAQGYGDYSQTETWSRAYIGAVSSAGLMSGYSDGTFRATSNMSRAESVVALTRALDRQPKGEVIQDYTITTSNYGSSQVQTINGNLYIDYAGNVTVRNLVVKGNIVIRSKLDGKTLTFTNVTCEGRFMHDYGNVTLDGCTVATYEATEKDSEIIVKNSSNITTGVFEQGVTVDQTGLSSSSTYKGFKAIELSGPSSADYTLSGNFPKVTIKAKSQSLTLKSGTIENLQISAASADVSVASGTYIDYVTFDAAGTILGAGTVRSAQVNVSGVKLQRAPKTLSGKYTPTYVAGEATLTVIVKNANTGAVIRGAEVTINGTTQTIPTSTSKAAEVTFDSIPYGSVTYKTVASNYSNKTGTHTVSASSSSHTLTIEMVPQGNYSATFTVTLSDMSASNYSGTTIRVDGGTAHTTGSDGKCTVTNLAQGSHTYTATKAGYATQTGSFTIGTSNVTQNVALAATKLTVEVKLGNTKVNSFQAAVEGIDNGAYKSTTTGGVVFDKLTYSQAYTVHVIVPGLPNASTSVTIDAASKTATITYNTYTVIVKDKTGAFIDDADVKLGNISPDITPTSGGTPGSGSYVFNNVTSGTYSLNVSVASGGYLVDTQSVTISATETKNVVLQKLYNYTVTVQEAAGANAPISGATVRLNSINPTSEANGVYTFENVPEDAYSLVVSAENYETKTTPVTVGAASLSTTVSLVATHSVTITVTDGTNPIEGASVSFGTYGPATTNASGEASFSNVAAGTYTVSVVFSSVTQTGAITVSDDSPISFTFTTTP